MHTRTHGIIIFRNAKAVNTVVFGNIEIYRRSYVFITNTPSRSYLSVSGFLCFEKNNKTTTSLKSPRRVVYIIKNVRILPEKKPPPLLVALQTRTVRPNTIGKKYINWIVHVPVVGKG